MVLFRGGVATEWEALAIVKSFTWILVGKKIILRACFTRGHLINFDMLPKLNTLLMHT